MGDEFTWNDRYAGDEAWTEWFEICSVDLCRPEFAARLREQVSSALYSRLARAGISREDAGGEDPVAFFFGQFILTPNLCECFQKQVSCSFFLFHVFNCFSCIIIRYALFVRCLA